MPELLTDSAFAFDPLQLTRAVFEDPERVRRRRTWLIKILMLWTFLALVALFVCARVFGWHFDLVWRYETVALLGASVGTAELLSRYRDAPSYVLLSPPGLGYVVINAAASLGAMGVILAFDWRFGTKGSPAAATQVLMAGFGAMALFRSSLLTVKAGNTDVGIGPSSVLSIMMAASDRSADRLRAAERAGRVCDIMKDVSFEKAQDALPTVASALLQNLNATDQAGLNADVASLKSSDLPDNTKALLLGLKITNVVSTAVLSAAKDSLGSSILVDAPPLAAGDQPAAEARRSKERKAHDRKSRSQSRRQLSDALASAAGEPPDSDAMTSDTSFASKELPQTPQTPDPHEAHPPA